MSTYNVALVFGGRSPEHEVSIITAQQVIEALSQRHVITPIYVTKTGEWLTGDRLLQLGTFAKADLPDSRSFDSVSVEFAPEARFCVKRRRLGWFGATRHLPVDVVFPLIHGTHGEDGTLQGLLELMDVPYVGAGVLGSAIGMDKLLMKAVLREHELPILPYVGFTKKQWETAPEGIVAEIERHLNYPVFVKPANSGSSIGVGKAENREALPSAIDLAVQYDLRCLVEAALEEATEINCSVLGNDDLAASVCEQPKSTGAYLSFDDKYIHRDGKTSGMAGAERLIPAPIPAELAAEIQALARKVFSALDCRGLARIDFLIGKDQRPFVNEINTIPGSLSFYLWQHDGVEFAELTERLIKLAFEIQGARSQLTYTYPSNVLVQLNQSSGKLQGTKGQTSA